MEVAKVKRNLQIEVSAKIKDWLKKEKELAVFLEGDTLILKKICVPDITSLAERVPEEAMPLSEIVDEVHRYRSNKKPSRE